MISTTTTVSLLAPIDSDDGGGTVLIGRTTEPIPSGSLLAIARDEWDRPTLVLVPDQSGDERWQWLEQFGIRKK